MICLWLAVTGSGRDFGIPDDSFGGSFFSQKNPVGVWKNEKPPSIWLSKLKGLSADFNLFLKICLFLSKDNGTEQELEKTVGPRCG